MITTVRGLLAATALVGAFAAAPAFADEAPASDITITGSATVASQYRFRGLSQSDNLPVIQGAITATHASGFYVGVWGSSASSSSRVDSSPIDIGGTELDVFGGYSKTIAGVTLDGGVYGYLYPGAAGGNYYELYGSVAKTYGPAKAKVGVNFAPAQKVFDASGSFPLVSSKRNNTYVYGELSSAIPGTPLSVHSHLGYTSGGFDYVRDYLDYSVGVSASWKALTLDASLVGTDLGRGRVTNNGYCEGDFGCGNYFYRPAKPVGVVSLTAAF